MPVGQTQAIRFWASLIDCTAASWNFVNFQGPNHSAIMMEYKTPPSYGSTIVNVGGLARDGEIIMAGSSNSAEHTHVKGDPESDWPEPGSVKFLWSGQTKDGKPVSASLEGSLGTRLDRVDVMAEVPGFVKKIVGGVAGARPYIYQVSSSGSPRPSDTDTSQYSVPMELKIKTGDAEETEKGILFSEATFISED